MSHSAHLLQLLHIQHPIIQAPMVGYRRHSSLPRHPTPARWAPLDWHQPSGEPDQFNITLRFALQPTTRLNSIEVAVDVNLKQTGGMVSGTASIGRLYTLESELTEIKLIDKNIDHSDRIILADIIERFRK